MYPAAVYGVGCFDGKGIAISDGDVGGMGRIVG